MPRHTRPPEMVVLDDGAMAASIHTGVRRARERAQGITSLDRYKRDRRAREAGTLADVEQLEDKLLEMANGRGER